MTVLDAAPLLLDSQREWDLSHKDGWFQMVDAPARTRPEYLTRDQIGALDPVRARAYRAERAAWHANLGPIRTPQLDAILADLDEICESNQHDGGKVKPAAVIDALPGLGKSTAASAFAKTFHHDQIELYGPQIATGSGCWQRVPVIYISLTSKTTMRSFNQMLCRFFALPGLERANAERLAHRAAHAIAACKARLIVVDDVHFLDMNSADGREVANHFKYLANTFPVTFLFVGVGLRARGLLGEGLPGTDAVFSQTARRWCVLELAPFTLETKTGRATWRALMLAIERGLVLAGAYQGMLADDLSDYLFDRSTGHFASLMSLINRGCARAIRTGTEILTTTLLEQVRIDEAAETARALLSRDRSRGRAR
jgi:hypothetical protein